MTHEITVIRKIKRPEGILRWPAYMISSDRYGLWLYSPKGTICRGQSGTQVLENEVGRGNREEGLPVLHLIPKEAWWIAAWCSLHLHFDICTPPTLIGGEWNYIDLELDPLVFPDGRVVIQDEDEFAAACETGLIPREEATGARTALEDVMRCLRSHTEPFGRVGWDKLKEAMSLPLAPIRVLRRVETP